MRCFRSKIQENCEKSVSNNFQIKEHMILFIPLIKSMTMERILELRNCLNSLMIRFSKIV